MSDQAVPPDMDSDLALNAWRQLCSAFENYQQTMQGDPTAQNYGFIFQASSSGIKGERLIWGAYGSSTEKLGLLALLSANVEQACIPQYRNDD